MQTVAICWDMSAAEGPPPTRRVRWGGLVGWMETEGCEV